MSDEWAKKQRGEFIRSLPRNERYQFLIQEMTDIIRMYTARRTRLIQEQNQPPGPPGPP